MEVDRVQVCRIQCGEAAGRVARLARMIEKGWFTSDLSLESIAALRAAWDELDATFTNYEEALEAKSNT